MSARYAIGIGNDQLHAVTAEHATDRNPTVRYVGAECGTTGIVAHEWGEFVRGNERLNSHRLCARCAWTVALANGTVEAEVAAVAPTAGEELAWGLLLPDPGLLVRTCGSILAARQAEEDYDADHPLWAQLLGHVTAHRPEILVPEDCAEGLGCEHDGDRTACYAASTTIACPACSIRAGQWAGEWEGQYEVTVPAPCSALLTVAAAYPGPE
jgi:hypothetical protein